ncbi:trans-aconitate 2-methyltransferase [Amycolatopsis sp. FDAARGOS 1241]|uniref:class I SAM-dependent methyltransferase n=1 Tax=Amycolatopsis sp. FDAARGOS 1241 TaxID=2778070 RepID=UPI001951F174|nr:class I SAM-dependent methyltransferase [Amycolatopsis sp. FDAARGOS 1241]QRP47238.1 class I SAM-dependent methyltransferase [Amycolatopsis sp. FDAARGOS 1241]
MPTSPDPVSALEAAVWAYAAVVATQREAADRPWADVLAAAPECTAVLEAAGLVRRDGDELVPHPSLATAEPAGVAAAKLSSLRQAVAAAAGEDAGHAGWSAQSDEVLLSQGRASAVTGRALATKIVPRLAGLPQRLAVPGSRVLDVGTGIVALALALVRALPQAEITGIDVLERALELAKTELADGGEAANRVTVRHQDVADVAEVDVYDLVWLPVPFLTEDVVLRALPRLITALVPGGWVVAGTNPAPPDPLRAAVGRWTAVRNGGNTYDSARMVAALETAGLGEVQQFPTVPGGPVLVAGRRPVD